MKEKNTGKLRYILLNYGPSVIALLAIFFLIIISRNSIKLNELTINSSKKIFFQNEEIAPAGIIGQNAKIDLPGVISSLEETVQENARAAPSEDAGAEANQTSDGAQTETIEASDDTNAEENQDAGENTNEAAEPALPPAPRADLIIGVVADAHAGQENGWRKLNTFAWRMANYEKPDIIIDLGDLIESRLKYKNISKKAAIADYKKARYLMSRYPVYNTIGNHEVFSMSKKDLKKITGRNNYYSVKVKGYNIIILDANYTGSGKIIDAGHEDDFIYTGAIPESQKEWLKNKLESNKMNLIFVHHPLYNLTNSDEIEDVIRDNKKRILLIANGHKHPPLLRIKIFGGVRNYDIPALKSKSGEQYAIIKINGSDAAVTGKRN